MPSLDMEIIGSIALPLPSIELQAEYSALIAAYEQTHRQWAESARQGDHLFQTLLQRALRGAL